MTDNPPLIHEAQMLLLAMKADTDAAKCVRSEIIEIVRAWHRGQLLPKAETPMLCKLYGTEFRP
jgi:hypothetical protein